MDLIDRISAGWKAWVLLFVLTMGAAAPGVFNMPALDRDESRFAQASKQMLETGDYIRIRYQDELRNKKPAGIHWLQAASTAIFTGPDAKQIWTYRVPSWIGAGLATLACFWCGIILIGRRAAFLGAALFGTTLLLTSEAHISKTDGMLVFLTTLSIGALARLYIRKDKSKKMALVFWLAIGLGFLIKGPVTPMVAIYAGLGAWVWTKAADGKGGDWWKPLLWWPGPLLFVILVLPWFTWVQLATRGEFLEGAVGKDLADKFTGASEGHGGWPLYHLTHIPAWFFPGTLLIAPAIIAAWQGLRGSTQSARRRGTDAVLIALALAALTVFARWVAPQTWKNGIMVAYPAILIIGFWLVSTRDSWWARWPQELTAPTPQVEALRFLAAWVVLTTLFFELMPTRLSHYILPAYPALGLLCGYAAIRMIDGAKMSLSRYSSLALFIFGGVVLMILSAPWLWLTFIMPEAAGDFKTANADAVMTDWLRYKSYPLWLWAVGGALTLAAAVTFAMKRVSLSIMLAVLSSFAIGYHIRTYMLPSQVWVQPTETARLALVDVCGIPEPDEKMGCDAPARVQAIGYAEPSYILTMGTQNLHPPETRVALPEDDAAYPVVFLVNLENTKAGADPASDVAKLEAEAARQGRCLTRSNSHYALNYNNGDPAHFIALRFDAGACP